MFPHLRSVNELSPLEGEYGYLALLRHVLEYGQETEDRTGVGTLSHFGAQIRFDLSKGFPLFTTKRVPFKSVLSELLWFLEGSTDERRLAEIHFGKPRSELADKTTIWTANATADYWEPEYEGDLGRVYGAQWVNWRTSFGTTVNQIENLIEGLKTNPHSRRHILQAWNPGELSLMALPPCHMMVQFYVRDNKLSCMYTMRSNDMFLGHPFNTASYALLTHMLAHVCGYEVGEVIYSGGDVHIYKNHVDQVKEQLTREPRRLPILRINGAHEELADFNMESFSIDGYDPHPAIKAEMAV